MSNAITINTGSSASTRLNFPIYAISGNAKTELSFIAPKSQQLFLSRLSGNKYRLLRNFLLLEKEYDENGLILIWEERSGIYGSGHNLDEALDDFQSMLEEMYEYLSSNESLLSNVLHEKLIYLRSILTLR